MSKSRNRILADDTVVLHRDEYERLLEAAENKEDRLALARSGEDESSTFPPVWPGASSLARRRFAFGANTGG